MYNRIKEREKREIIIDLESDKKLLLYIKDQKERREMIIDLESDKKLLLYIKDQKERKIIFYRKK